MIINLHQYYPDQYRQDYFIDVEDEIAETLIESERAEHAYRMRRNYHKAYYSLDRGDGIEREAILSEQSPESLCIRKAERKKLHHALSVLSNTQRTKIYKHFFLGLNKSEIGRKEGVSEASVWESIQAALHKLKRKL